LHLQFLHPSLFQKYILIFVDFNLTEKQLVISANTKVSSTSSYREINEVFYILFSKIIEGVNHGVIVCICIHTNTKLGTIDLVMIFRSDEYDSFDTPLLSQVQVPVVCIIGLGEEAICFGRNTRLSN